MIGLRTRAGWCGTGIAVLLAVLVVGVSASAAGRFTDDDGSVHEGSIEAIAREGITRGCNPPVNDRFCPSEPVTRGQMAAFLRRAFGLPAATQDYFLDDDGSVFEGDINALAEAGITKGCNPPRNNHFCPGGLVTRGEMAAFLRRAFALPTSNTNFFVDDSTSIFEREINAIAARGITRGCNPPANDRYCPDDHVSRAQMASFLTRALDLMPITPPDPCQKVDAAAIYVSTSGADGNDGSCDSPFRTIQRGIDIAPVGGRVIVSSGTYLEVIEVPKSLTLEGSGPGFSIIDGAGSDEQMPAASVRLGVTVKISGFTIRNGPAGGLDTSATLTLEDVEIVDNGGSGWCTAGGMANSEGGDLTARNVEVVGNTCDTAVYGAGGVWNAGSLTLEDSLIRGNRSLYSGGGLVNQGDATVVSTTVSFNEAKFNGGGGVTNRGDLLMRNAVISDNAVTDEQGGGVLNDAGEATLENVSVIRNDAGLEGGGVATRGESVTVVLRDTLVAANEAGGNPGYNRESGGGLVHQVGVMLIESSAITNNQAIAQNPHLCCGGRGGGIYAYADLTLTNVTISSNESNVEGGGIDVWIGGQVTATNVTIAQNGSPEGGGVMVHGEFDVTNTLLADAVSGLNCALGSTDGEIRSFGHNLDDDGSCDLDAAGDLSGVDPLLEALADNGGATPTHAVSPASPAVDAGDGVAAPPTDQRGTLRPQGPGVDIGAYELSQ